jgi:hypothetical protein
LVFDESGLPTTQARNQEVVDHLRATTVLNATTDRMTGDISERMTITSDLLPFYICLLHVILLYATYGYATG